MSDDVMFDVVQVQLFLPAQGDEAVADAASAALEDPEFLTAVERAVQAVLDAVPALAPLSARAEW